MSLNTQSLTARRIKTPSDCIERQEPGDFAWEFDFTHFEHGAKPTDERLTIYIVLPGQSVWAPIHVVRATSAINGQRIWHWDGNFDQPTLSPSIHHVGRWHGYMTAGRLVSV